MGQFHDVEDSFGELRWIKTNHGGGQKWEVVELMVREKSMRSGGRLHKLDDGVDDRWYQ